MAGFHSESYPAPAAEPGLASAPGFPGTAPYGVPRAATRSARGPDQTRLLWAALALGVCVIAAFVIPLLGAGYARAFAAAGVVAGLLLAGVLAALHQRYRSALSDAARGYEAALASVAGWEQGAAEQQRRERELEQRTGERESRYRTMTASALEALGHQCLPGPPGPGSHPNCQSLLIPVMRFAFKPGTVA